jgi:hypothetical protein
LPPPAHVLIFRKAGVNVIRAKREDVLARTPQLQTEAICALFINVLPYNVLLDFCAQTGASEDSIFDIGNAVKLKPNQGVPEEKLCPTM